MKNEKIKEITRKAIEQLIAALNEGRNGISKCVRDTEAELISFVVCNAIGV